MNTNKESIERNTENACGPSQVIGTCNESAQAQPPKRFQPFKLNGHKASPVNDLMEIVVTDEAGSGGAHHSYVTYWPSGSPFGEIKAFAIRFQMGPIGAVGINGLTQEVLLEIVRHRLECFCKGPYSCKENFEAHHHVVQALEILKARTKERMARGVEGTYQK